MTKEFEIAGMTVQHDEDSDCSKLVFLPPKEGQSQLKPEDLFEEIVIMLEKTGYGVLVDAYPGDVNNNVGIIDHAELTHDGKSDGNIVDYQAVSSVLTQLSQSPEMITAVASRPQEPIKKKVDELGALLRAAGKEILPVPSIESRRMQSPLGNEVDVDVIVPRSR